MLKYFSIVLNVKWHFHESFKPHVFVLPSVFVVVLKRKQVLKCVIVMVIKNLAPSRTKLRFDICKVHVCRCMLTERLKNCSEKCGISRIKGNFIGRSLRC